ncbi:MAG: hypothetical protein OXK82_06785 [Deltaproteobacteria bacterium]|nr:hypothetical protein [Deltaproteobacteria bacterium]
MTSPLIPASVLSEVSRTYDRRVMNNVHRSEYVEAIVALALKDSGWKRMTPWDSWDCEHESRVRLEVKQSAFAQGWGERNSLPRFDIAPRTGYWINDGGQWVDQTGRHADIYVFAWHGERRDTADQRDPGAWEFYVVLERDLPTQKTIGLAAIRSRAAPRGVEELAVAVERSRTAILPP